MIRKGASGSLVGIVVIIVITAIANLLMHRVAVEPVGVVVVPTPYTTSVGLVVNGSVTSTVVTYDVNLTKTVFRPTQLTGPYFGVVVMFLVVNAFIYALYMFTVMFPRISRRVLR